MRKSLTREDYVALYQSLELTIATTRITFDAAGSSRAAIGAIGRKIHRLQILSREMRDKIRELTPYKISRPNLPQKGAGRRLAARLRRGPPK